MQEEREKQYIQRMKQGFDCLGVGIGAAIINKEGKLFLALRSQKTKNERGLWETPGGGLEFGEKMEEAIIREMNEEYGIKINPIRVLHVFDHLLPEEKQHWIAISFLAEIESGEPIIKEPRKCDQIGWFTLAEIEKMPLTLTAKMDIAELKKLKLLRSSVK